MFLYSNTEIQEVLDDGDVFQPTNFLLDLGFSDSMMTTDDVILFDKVSRDMRISTYVGSGTKAKARPKRGFETQMYLPAYVKDLEIIRPTDIVHRMAGEKLAQPRTPQERYMLQLIQRADLMRNRLTRLKQKMAAQLLKEGKVTAKGDGIDVTVDFNRNVNLTRTLTGGDVWSDANTTISPWKILEAMVNRCVTPIRHIVMGQANWRYLKEDSDFERMMFEETFYGGAGASSLYQNPITQVTPVGVTFRGSLKGSGIQLWTYSETYEHPVTGADTYYIAPDEMVFIPDASYGVQVSARIDDPEAMYEAMEMFFKNFQDNDPAYPQLLMQAAPMLLHKKINSTAYLKTGASIPESEL